MPQVEYAVVDGVHVRIELQATPAGLFRVTEKYYAPQQEADEQEKAMFSDATSLCDDVVTSPPLEVWA